MAHGLKRVEMGPTAYGAKMLRGYQPIRSDAYVLVLDDAARATVAKALDEVDVDELWEHCREEM